MGETQTPESSEQRSDEGSNEVRMQWSCRALTLAGNLADVLGTGSLDASFSVAISYEVADRNYVLVHDQSGSYSVVEIGEDGLLGSVTSSGSFSSYYPAMLSYIAGDGHCYWLGQAADKTWTSRELLEDGSIGEPLAHGLFPFSCSVLDCCKIGDTLYAVGPNKSGRGLLIFSPLDGGAIGAVHERAWASDENLFMFTQGGKGYLLALMDGRFYSFEVSTESLELSLCAFDSFALLSGDADATLTTACVFNSDGHTLVFAQEEGGQFIVFELFEGGRRWAEVCRGTSPKPYDHTLVFSREGGARLVGLTRATSAPALALGASTEAATTPHTAATLGVETQASYRNTIQAFYEARELRAEGPAGDIRATGEFSAEFAHILTFAAGSSLDNGLFVCSEDGSYTIFELTSGQIGQELASGSLGRDYPVLFAFVAEGETYLFGHRNDASWVVRPLDLGGVGDGVATGSLDAYYPVLVPFKGDAYLLGQKESGTCKVWDLTHAGPEQPRDGGTLGRFHEVVIPFGFLPTDKDVGFCLVHSKNGNLDTFELSHSGLGEHRTTSDLGGFFEVALAYRLGREDTTLLYMHDRRGAWSVRELVPARERRAAPWYERDGETLPWLAEADVSGSRQTDTKVALVLPAWPRPNLLEVSVVTRQPLTRWMLQGVEPSGSPELGAATGEILEASATVFPFAAGGRPWLFTHKQNGEWAVYDLPSGHRVGEQVASGNLLAFHPSMFAYTQGGATYIFAQRVDGGYSTWNVLGSGALGEELASGTLPYFCPEIFPCMINNSLYGMGLRATEASMLLFPLTEGGLVGDAAHRKTEPGAKLYPFTAGGQQYVLSRNGFELAICTLDTSNTPLKKVGGASRDDIHDTFVALANGEETFLLGQRVNGDWKVYGLADDNTSLVEVAKGACDRFYPKMHAVRVGDRSAVFAVSPAAAPAPLVPLPAGGLWMGSGFGKDDTPRVAAFPAYFAQFCLLPYGRTVLLHCQDGSYQTRELLGLVLGKVLSQGDFGAYYPILLTFGGGPRFFALRGDGTWFIRSFGGTDGVGQLEGSGTLDRFYPSILDVSRLGNDRLMGIDEDGGWTLWSVPHGSGTLIEEATGTLDGSYVNFTALPWYGESKFYEPPHRRKVLKIDILGQRSDGSYTVWVLSSASKLEHHRDGTIGEFCPTVVHCKAANIAPLVLAERADGSYELTYPNTGHSSGTGTFGRYYPKLFVEIGMYGFRALASAPDPNPPGAQWLSQRLMPDGTAGEHPVEGRFGPVAPAVLAFSNGTSSFLMLLQESGHYRTHLLDGAGNIGVEQATGRLPHYYPTMCTFTKYGQLYWLGQREDGVYSVRPIFADGRLGKEHRSGKLPFACTTLFVYSVRNKQFCFGYNDQKTLLCEVWRTCTLGKAKLDVGVKGSLPFRQNGIQYFLTPMFTTYVSNADGSWQLVAAERLAGSDIAAYTVPVSADGRVFVVWQTLVGHVYVIELFDGGRRLSRLSRGLCKRIYEKLLSFSVSGFPFVFGLTTQGKIVPLVLTQNSDDIEYPRRTTSTIPTLTPPDPPIYTNLAAAEVPTEILRASIDWMDENPDASNFQRTAFSKELSRRGHSLSRGLVLGGSRYIVIPPMNVSFAKGFIIQMWVRPLSLVDNASLFEIEDPTDPDKQILLRSMANGSVELLWHNQSSDRRALVMKHTALKVNRWSLLIFAFDGTHVRVQLDGNESTPDYLTAEERAEFKEPVIDANDVASFMSRVARQSKRSLFQELTPLEGERTRGYIGRGVVGGPSNLNIGEVRLWNYFPYWQEIQRCSNSILRGDEFGLVGYWRPLDFQTPVKDHSPFERHGHLVGQRKEGPFPAPKVGYYRTHIALRIGQDKPGITVKDLERSWNGLTWQASVLLGKGKLVELYFHRPHEFIEYIVGVNYGSDRRLRIWATDGGMPVDWHDAISGPEVSGSWVHLAVVMDVQGMCSFFVNGERASEPQRLFSFPDRLVGLMKTKVWFATFGQGWSGHMAEVRLWNRALSDDLIQSTTGRRIHRWAPGLIAYLRLNEDPTIDKIRRPFVVGPDAPAENVGEFVTNSGHGLAPAPSVASSAVLSTERGTAKLRGNVALPESPSGFSVQFWLRTQDANTTPVVKLVDEQEPGMPVRFCIDWVPNDNLKVLLRDANGEIHRVTVRSSLVVDEWVHLTVTADRDGVVCIYRDGVLVARDVVEAYEPAKTNLLEFGKHRRFTEFRMWEKALTQAEVLSNWKLKLPESRGLAQRFALDSNPFDFAGSPTEAWVMFREDPSIRWGESPPQRHTITATSELVSELVDMSKVEPLNPSTFKDLPAEVTSSRDFGWWVSRAHEYLDENGSTDYHQTRHTRPAPQFRMSFLAIDLIAKDGRGRALPRTMLTVVLSKRATLYRNSGRAENRIGIPYNLEFELETDTNGHARILIKVENLAAPIFNIRHGGMGVGEWVVVTPDQVLHDALASLSPEEVRGGRKASAGRQKTTGSLVTDVEHSEKLARMLRTMLGCAAAATFELQSTQMLAFGIDDESVPGTPIEPLHTESGAGVHVELPEGMVVVRRIGRPLKTRRASEDNELTPLSFGFWDDVGDFFEDCGEMIVDTAEEVVDHIAVAIDTAFDGIQVAFDAVVRTVEDMAGAVWNVLKTIGNTIMEIVNFLCGLFDFSDFLDTSDFLLDQLIGVLDGARRTSANVLGMGGSLVADLEGVLLSALGDSSQSKPQQKQDAPPFDIDLGGPLGFVLGQLSSVLDPLLESLTGHLGPLATALDSTESKIKELLSSVTGHLRNSDFVEKIGSLTSIADGDPLELILSLVKDVVRIVMSVLRHAVDFVATVVDALFEVLTDVLTTRVDVPVLTWLFETVIGRELTIGRIVSLIIAIPLTLAYKLISGSSDGPFASSEVLSFSDSERSVDGAALAVRALDLALGVLLSYTNVLHIHIKTDPKWEDEPGYKGLRWQQFMFSFLKSVVRSNPHIRAMLKGTSLDEMNETEKILTYVAWGCNCTSHVCKAVSIKYGSAVKYVSYTGVVFSVGALGCSIAAGQVSDKTKTWDMGQLEGRLNVYDATTMGAFGAGSFLSAVSHYLGHAECVPPVIDLFTLSHAISAAAMVDLIVSDPLD